VAAKPLLTPDSHYPWYRGGEDVRNTIDSGSEKCLRLYPRKITSRVFK
jgi:hypothetical protein